MDESVLWRICVHYCPYQVPTLLTLFNTCRITEILATDKPAWLGVAWFVTDPRVLKTLVLVTFCVETKGAVVPTLLW